MKNPFHSNIEIAVDLGKIPLVDINGFPIEGKQDYTDYYTSKVFDDNHFQVTSDGGRAYESGLNDVRYNKEAHKISIYSQHKSPRAYAVFIWPLFTIYLIFKNCNSDILWHLIIATILLTNGAGGLLYISMRSNGKKIQRELIIRINHQRRIKGLFK